MPTEKQFTDNLEKLKKEVDKATISNAVMANRTSVITRFEDACSSIIEFFQKNFTRESVETQQEENKLIKSLKRSIQELEMQIPGSRAKSDVMVDIFCIAIKEDKLDVVKSFSPENSHVNFILEYPEKVGQALSEAKSFTASSYVKKQCMRLCETDDGKAVDTVTEIAIAAKDPALLEHALKNGARVTGDKTEAAKKLELSDKANTLLEQNNPNAELEQFIENFNRITPPDDDKYERANAIWTGTINLQTTIEQRDLLTWEKEKVFAEEFNKLLTKFEFPLSLIEKIRSQDQSTRWNNNPLIPLINNMPPSKAYTASMKSYEEDLKKALKQPEPLVKKFKIHNDKDMEFLEGIAKIAEENGLTSLAHRIKEKQYHYTESQKESDGKSSPRSKKLLFESRGDAFSSIFPTTKSNMSLFEQFKQALAPEPNQGGKVNKADTPQQGRSQTPQRPKSPLR